MDVNNTWGWMIENWVLVAFILFVAVVSGGLWAKQDFNIALFLLSVCAVAGTGFQVHQNVIKKEQELKDQENLHSKIVHKLEGKITVLQDKTSKERQMHLNLITVLTDQSKTREEKDAAVKAAGDNIIAEGAIDQETHDKKLRIALANRLQAQEAQHQRETTIEPEITNLHEHATAILRSLLTLDEPLLELGDLSEKQGRLEWNLSPETSREAEVRQVDTSRISLFVSAPKMQGSRGKFHYSRGQVQVEANTRRGLRTRVNGEHTENRLEAVEKVQSYMNAEFYRTLAELDVLKEKLEKSEES